MKYTKSDTIRTAVISGMAGAMVAGGVTWAVSGSSISPVAMPPAQAASVLPAPTREPAAIGDVTRVVERAVESVVSIRATKISAASDGPMGRLPHGFPFGFGEPSGPREQRGQGSGVIVRADGIVLTNNHVVADATELTIVTPDGEELEATVVGTDAKTDLAVLRIKSSKGRSFEALPMGSSDGLKLGETVLAIGNPFGVGQTVTQGIVSAKGRADLGINAYEDFIQTDAAINPGNSGGALVNLRGELVGINTAILSRNGGNMGIGFAIPAAMVKPVLMSLLETGHVDRGWLGVSIQDVDRDMLRALNLGAKRGVLVADVELGSPAERGGLERGDVVLEVNGTQTETTGQLRNAIALAGSDREVTLRVAREGQEQTLKVKLGSTPDASTHVKRGSVVTGEGEAGALDGVFLQSLDERWRGRLRVPKDVAHGVVVTRVEGGSPAAKAGLRPGDIILELDRKAVTDLEAFSKSWKASPDRGARLLLVYRQGRRVFLATRE